MKVLVLSHISEMLGGAERSMLDVFDYWAEHYGVKPQFILRQPVKTLAGELKKRRWKYHELRYTFWSDGNPPKKESDIYNNAVLNGHAIEDIERLIKDIKPDLVMTNSIVCPWAALAAYNQKIPHVWFVREYGDLDHGRIYEIGREKTYQDVDNLSSLIVANSSSLAKYLRQYIEKEKVTALYNPFNLNEIRQNALQKVENPFKDDTALKLLITGNLAPSKGQHEAIEAVIRLNNDGHRVELCVIGRAGDPKYYETIQSLIHKNGANDKIHFVGYQVNPLAFVSLADVCIMASRQEAFGRVTFEYLAVGKPVVGVNSGATPEMVKPGSNGYLYEYDNTSSLVSALQHYVSNKELITEHGKASKKQAEAMMHGQLNIDVLYKKVAKLVGAKVSQGGQPINYFVYMDKLLTNNKNENTQHRFSIKQKLRHKAKSAYVRARSIKARVTGR